MATPVGKSYLTLSGLLALTDATKLGKKITPKYFKVSSKDYDLYPGVDLKDLEEVWYQGDISGVIPVGYNSTQFIIDIPPEKAEQYGRTFGLYLEDGTLFLVAKPPYPFAPLLRQTFTVQLTWQNVNEVIDFKYVPFYETEQNLLILDLSASLGSRIIKLKKDVELLKNAQDVLFANDSEFKNQIEKLEEAVKALWGNQLSIFSALATHAMLLIQHKQDIEKLKGGV
jgi:hypothetical protein